MIIDHPCVTPSMAFAQSFSILNFRLLLPAPPWGDIQLGFYSGIQLRFLNMIKKSYDIQWTL